MYKNVKGIGGKYERKKICTSKKAAMLQPRTYLWINVLIYKYEGV